MDLLKKQYQLQGNRSVEVIPRLKSFWVGEALHCYFLPNSKSKPRGWSQKESQFIYIFNYKNKGNYLNNKVKVYIFSLNKEKMTEAPEKEKKEKNSQNKKITVCIYNKLNCKMILSIRWSRREENPFGINHDSPLNGRSFLTNNPIYFFIVWLVITVGNIYSFTILKINL